MKLKTLSKILLHARDNSVFALLLPLGQRLRLKPKQPGINMVNTEIITLGVMVFNATLNNTYI